MKELNCKVTGKNILLMNNPQVADPLHEGAKELKAISSKRTKTDDDYLLLSHLSIKWGVFWDNDLGIYIPSSWIFGLLCGHSFKQAKVSKKEIRSAVFINEMKFKLKYDGDKSVKSLKDIVENEKYHFRQTLKQGQVMVAKTRPQFHKWSFDFSVVFDDTLLDERTLKQILEYGFYYGGIGDFRPTFGRANIEFV
jgi:hypothetical protein